MWSIQTEPVDPTRNQIRIGREPDTLRKIRRLSPTGQITCHDGERIRQCCELVVPHPTILQTTVKEHEWRSAAGPLERDDKPFNVDQFGQTGLLLNL